MHVAPKRPQPKFLIPCVALCHFLHQPLMRVLKTMPLVEYQVPFPTLLAMHIWQRCLRRYDGEAADMYHAMHACGYVSQASLV